MDVARLGLSNVIDLGLSWLQVVLKDRTLLRDVRIVVLLSLASSVSSLRRFFLRLKLHVTILLIVLNSYKLYYLDN